MNADRPMDQSREAHHPARLHHSPRGAYSPGRSETVHDTHGPRTRNVLSYRHATSPRIEPYRILTTNVAAQQGY